MPSATVRFVARDQGCVAERADPPPLALPFVPVALLLRAAVRREQVPAVSSVPPKGPTVETGLSDSDKETFEHLLGHGLRKSSAVSLVTQEFVRRALAVVLHGVDQSNKTAASGAIKAAFADPKFGPGNTGYVGPDVDAITRVVKGVAKEGLNGANIREVWALMYALTKDSWENPFGETLQKATSADIKALELNGPAVLARRAAIAATEGAPKSFDKYSNGIGDWSYEGFDSWVRFDFSASTLAGAPLWAGARAYASKTACTGGPDGQTTLMSNDPSIQPPLSAAELQYHLRVVLIMMRTLD
jgi:hypothetical protein